MSNSNSSTSEFQCVLLVGGTGHRLYPLTEKMCKHLLPVVNQPLIGYQLQMLEKSGFVDVIVVTNTLQATDISSYIQGVYKGKIRAQIIILPDDFMGGTADVLRYISDELHHDFFVLSGDIISNVFLHYLADIHRSKNASLTMLLAEQNRSKQQSKTDDKITRCYVGISTDEQIVLYKSALEIEEQQDYSISKSLLQEHPNIKFSNRYKDMHVYLFSYWIIHLLKEKSKFDEIESYKI